jgi:hypothetical protein
METAEEHRVDLVDELLMDWYEWTQSYVPAVSYRTSDASCSGFQSSKQYSYEDLDDDVVSELRATIGRAVEPFIDQLSQRHRCAIQAWMLNLQVGRSVWHNARVLEDDYQDARTILRQMFRAHGIFTLKGA